MKVKGKNELTLTYGLNLVCWIDLYVQTLCKRISIMSTRNQARASSSGPFLLLFKLLAVLQLAAAPAFTLRTGSRLPAADWNWQLLSSTGLTHFSDFFTSKFSQLRWQTSLLRMALRQRCDWHPPLPALCSLLKKWLFGLHLKMSPASDKWKQSTPTTLWHPSQVNKVGRAIDCDNQE